MSNWALVGKSGVKMELSDGNLKGKTMEAPTYSIGNSHIAALMQGSTSGAPIHSFCGRVV